MKHACSAFALAALALASAATGQVSAPAAAAAAPAGAPAAPCRATEVARNLDFWVGNWDVYVGTQLVGTDRVERILNGCAVVEHWRDTLGEEGISLFGYDARRNIWTQNWVTPDTSVPGGIKYKVLRAHSPTSTTFQGELEGSNGTIYYDRTILTALPDHNVHQEIQVSRDGVNWHTQFDAIYRPHA